MRSIQEIKSTLGNHKDHLFSDYPIQSIAIFGSFSRKDNIKDSDLDIIVEFHDKIGIRFIDLAEEIEKIVGLRVDLVSKNGIKEKYLKSISSDLIYV
jgi:hypothetical protein